MGWISLISEDQLLAIKQSSYQQAVMIFKHSTSCSTSAIVLDRFERKWQGGEIGNLPIYFLDLLRYRSISDQISIEFDVCHESPQLLVIEGGLATYHDSHFGIDYQKLLAYLQKA